MYSFAITGLDTLSLIFPLCLDSLPSTSVFFFVILFGYLVLILWEEEKDLGFVCVSCILHNLASGRTSERRELYHTMRGGMNGEHKMILKVVGNWMSDLLGSRNASVGLLMYY